MSYLVDSGLLILCCCAGTALRVVAQAVLARVNQLGRER